MAITSIATLTEVKDYIRIPNPGAPNPDDAKLQDFMDGAQAVIEKEVGHIVPFRVRNEKHDGGPCKLFLRELPVLYIITVEEGWGYFNEELDDQEVNTIPALSLWAYSLDSKTQGIISRRAPGNVLYPFLHGEKNIRIEYVAGREEVPANAKLAFKELVAHWYRVSQLRSTNQPGGNARFAPSALNDDNRAKADAGINLGVPSEIIAMLKNNRRRPIIG